MDVVSPQASKLIRLLECVVDYGFHQPEIEPLLQCMNPRRYRENCLEIFRPYTDSKNANHPKAFRRSNTSACTPINQKLGCRELLRESDRFGFRRVHERTETAKPVFVNRATTSMPNSAASRMSSGMVRGMEDFLGLKQTTAEAASAAGTGSQPRSQRVGSGSGLYG